MTPESFSILGKPFTVEEVESEGFVLDADEGQMQLGEHDVPGLTIRLYKHQHEASKRATLLHEVLHELNDAVGVELEERDVCALSSALYALAQESSDAVRWMLNLEQVEV